MKKLIITIFVITLIGGTLGAKELFIAKEIEEPQERIHSTFQSGEIDLATNSTEEEIQEKIEEKPEENLIQEEMKDFKKEKVENPKQEESVQSKEPPKSSSSKSTNKETTNSTKSDSKSSKPENKKLSKSKIEEYLKKNIPDFRYDFDTVKDCQDEGNKWAEYGWFYNCPYVSVPNSDIKPVMLVVSTGKFFCDGEYTKNEKIYWKKPKISSISYLREIGYPCENIEGTN